MSSKITRAGQIDLRLSPESRKSLEEYRKSLEATSAQVKGLVQDLANVKKVSDAIRAKGFAETGNLGGYLQGVRAQQKQAISRTTFAGTSAGQQAAGMKELARQQRELLTGYREQNRLEGLIGTTMARQMAALGQINSLQQLKIQKLGAEKALSDALFTRDRLQIRQAESLNRAVDERIAKVKELNREQDRAAKAQARRETTIQNNLRGDPALERSQGAKSRRMTLDRLRGDGGAGLFQVQGAILANYAIMGGVIGGITEGIRFAAQFDNELRNLQAIVKVTDENMKGLREEILQVSEATKFSAVEIAAAATTLGQAGFSTKEIQDSVRAVSLLATATGTDLAQSVDIATSVLGVFDMESSQMAGVANTLTAAVNGSKLNIDKLTLGLQYAGNTAAQSGVSFEELTASLGAMANAGIRSGSTLGTGMRQILITLQKPSKEFIDTLGRLGLSMADVDLKTKGLYGVMQTLRDAGFSSADAIRSFEVRAASAFNALSGNIEQVVELERSFINSQAAAEANETQMRSLTNQSKRLGANLGALAYTGLEPLLYLTRDVFSGISDLVEAMRDAPEAVKLVASSVFSLGAALAGLKLLRLGAGLAASIIGMNGLTRATAAAAVTTGTLNKSLVFTRALMGPIGALTAAAIVGYQAYQQFGNETAKAASEVERAQTQFDRAKGAVDEYGKKIATVDGKLEEITSRHKILGENQNLLDLETEKVREQFREMGIELGENVTSVEELVRALQGLRGELATEYEVKIGQSAADLGDLIEKKEEQRRNIPRSGYLLADRAAGDDEKLREANRIAADPTATIDQLSAARRVAASRISSAANGGDITRGQLNMAKAIERVTTAAIEAEGSLIGLRRELTDTLNNQADQRSRNRNSELMDRLQLFGDVAQPLMTGTIAGSDGSGAEGAYRAGVTQFQALQADASELRAAVENSDLTDRVKEEVLRQLDNSLAEAEMGLEDLAQAAGKAAEAEAERAQAFRDIERRRLEEKLGRAQDPAQLEASSSRIRGMNRAELEANRSVAQGEFDRGQLSAEDRNLAFAEAFDNYLQQQAALDGMITEKTEEFTKARIAALDAAAERLAAEIEGAEARSERLLDGATKQSDIDMARDSLQGLNDSAREAAIAELDERLEMNEIDQGAYQTALIEIQDQHAERQAEIREMTADAVERIAKEALDQANRLIADLQRRLGVDRNLMVEQLDGTSSIADTYDINTAMDANARLSADAERQSIEQDPNLDAQEQLTRIAEMEQQLAAQIQQNANEARAARARIFGVEQKQLQTELKNLELDLRQSGSLEEREAIREAQRAKIQEEAALTAQMAQDMALDTAAGQAELQAALADIASQERADLLAVEQASQQDKLEEAALTLETAQSALDATLQLAADAETLRARNEYLKQAMVQLAAVASAAQGVETAKNEAGVDTPEANANATADLMAGLNKRLNGIRRSALPKDRSGGGGRKKKKEKEEDPIDKLIEDLTGQFEAAKKMVDIGEATNFSFDDTIFTAAKELDKITSQIKALNARMANGSLTAKEQEKLNTLVERHSKLTAFIKEQEAEIARIKIEQGDYMGGATMLAAQWAEQNLNMTDIMVNGFTSALGTMKSGIASFFTEWSNGTKSARAAFQGMALSVVGSIQSIVAEMMSAWILQKALGWAFGTDTTGLGGFDFTKLFGGGRSQTRPRARPAAAGRFVEGNVRRDGELHSLMPGEYVLRASAVQAIGKENLDQMNALGNTVLSKSGRPEMPKPKSGGDGTVNVWVVPPETKPNMGANDIIAIISDDISRNGTTKKLIKSVQMGA